MNFLSQSCFISPEPSASPFQQQLIVLLKMSYDSFHCCFCCCCYLLVVWEFSFCDVWQTDKILLKNFETRCRFSFFMIQKILCQEAKKKKRNEIYFNEKRFWWNRMILPIPTKCDNSFSFLCPKDNLLFFLLIICLRLNKNNIYKGRYAWDRYHQLNWCWKWSFLVHWQIPCKYSVGL